MMKSNKCNEVVQQINRAFVVSERFLSLISEDVIFIGS